MESDQQSFEKSFESTIPVQVCLEQFEGPLDLLLYLVKKDKMDIFEINIHHITTQYLNYLQEMKELNLNIAGEFIAMASQLIYIKSRLVLPPKEEAEGEEESPEELKRRFVQRLVEYEKVKKASQKLYCRDLVGRDEWINKVGRKNQLPVLTNDAVSVSKDTGPMTLGEIYHFFMNRLEKGVYQVTKPFKTVVECIELLVSCLKSSESILFFSFIKQELRVVSKSNIVTSFLSLLEMAKLQMITVYQSSEDISLKKAEKFSNRLDFSKLDEVVRSDLES